MLLTSLFQAGTLLAAATLTTSRMEYIEIDSSALQREVRVGVYLPEKLGDDQRVPVIYFLHGLNGSERKWEERGIPGQMDELLQAEEIGPTLVVCPDGQNSMYVNWINGEADWEDFISDELVAAIDERYPTIDEPEARGITGDSMGGYGALLIGMQNPDVFGSISAHSAALYPPDPSGLPDWMKQRVGHIYGSPIDIEFWKSKNPLHLAETLDEEQLRSARIYLDVGTDDRFGFDRSGTQFSEILKKRGIPHRYELRDGGHGKVYFQTNVNHSIRFHCAAFEAVDAKD